MSKLCLSRWWWNLKLPQKLIFSSCLTPQVEPSQSCLSAVKSMRTCPACQGLPAIPPCPGFCLNVMKGCLAHHYQVDDLWARFIGNSPALIHIQMYAHTLPLPSRKYPPPHTNSAMSKPTLELDEP